MPPSASVVQAMLVVCLLREYLGSCSFLSLSFPGKPYVTYHLRGDKGHLLHEASSRCPPAPLPCLLPCAPLLILMPVARNAGGALCAGRSALQKGAGAGPTGVRNTMQARALEFLEHHASPALVTRRPPHTHQALNHTRGARDGAQRGSWGPGTLCSSAPFAPPRPPAESPRTALSSHQCLML